jgi:hypothetical protein
VSTFPLYEDHTDAFLHLVQVAFVNTVVLVGDGEEPPGCGWRAAPGQATYVPYVIVYPMATTPGESTIDAPLSDAEFEWQTTISSASRAQAQRVFDLLAQVLVDERLEVPGRACSDHLRLTTDGGGVRREEFNQQPPLWVATPRWAITTVPA